MSVAKPRQKQSRVDKLVAENKMLRAQIRKLKQEARWAMEIIHDPGYHQGKVDTQPKSLVLKGQLTLPGFENV